MQGVLGVGVGGGQGPGLLLMALITASQLCPAPV